LPVLNEASRAARGANALPLQLPHIPTQLGSLEAIEDDGASGLVAIFGGGDARQRAIRYADREYGAFDEIELEPYQHLSEE